MSASGVSVAGNNSGNNNDGSTINQPSPNEGLNGTQPPQEIGAGARGYGSPAAAQRAATVGLVAALQELVNKETPDSIAAAFNKQLKIYNNYTNPKATQFMEEAALSTDFMVLAFIPDSAVSKIKLAWGITEFRDDDVNNDVPVGTIALVGDRDKNGNTPPVVTLPAQNAVKWVKVNGLISRDVYESVYLRGEDSRELRQLNSGGGNKHFPRMLYVPPHLALFLATQPRGHHDLYYETKRLVADGASGIEQSHVQLILDWCVAASYQFNKTTVKDMSLLKLSVTPIMSDFLVFIDWKRQKVNTALGEVGAVSTTAAQASTTQTTTPPASRTADMEMLATLMKDQQECSFQFTERMLKQQQELFMNNPRTQGAETGTFKDLKALESGQLLIKPCLVLSSCTSPYQK